MKAYSTIFIIFLAVFFILGTGEASADHAHYSDDYYYDNDYYGQNTYFGPSLQFDYSYESSRSYGDRYGSNYGYYGYDDYGYDSYDYDRYYSRDYYGRNTVYGDPYASYRRNSRSDRYLNRPYGENIFFDTFGAYRVSRY